MMKIKKIEITRPPENTKITIGDETCKCIKHDNKTWVNIRDLTLKGQSEVYRLVKYTPNLLDNIIELSLYGQGDYYVESTNGLDMLNKAISDNDFWYPIQ
jgi:hypothetical protein